MHFDTNKFGCPLHYRPSPTPPRSYTAKQIYPWNIDSLSVYDTRTVLQNMQVYSSACKFANCPDTQIAELITAGFTGKLRAWWDNCVTQNEKNGILSGRVITGGNQLEVVGDAVDALLKSIAENFIGDPVSEENQAREILNGLRCPTLAHFRWYKDMFLMNVFRLRDAPSEHWKERFVLGLPEFVAVMVMRRLRKLHGGAASIPYGEYTYGRLVSECVDEMISVSKLDELEREFESRKKSSRRWKRLEG